MKKNNHSIDNFLNNYAPATEEEKKLFLEMIIETLEFVDNKFIDLRKELIAQRLEVKEYPIEIEEEMIYLDVNFEKYKRKNPDFPGKEIDREIKHAKKILELWENRCDIIEKLLDYGESVLLQKDNDSLDLLLNDEVETRNYDPFTPKHPRIGHESQLKENKMFLTSIAVLTVYEIERKKEKEKYEKI